MDLGPFLAAPVQVQIHALSAFVALPLGAALLIAPKGTIPHRTLGYVWVALMLAAAVSAIAIRSSGSFSWIHIFVPITLIGVFDLVRQARAGRVARHRGAILGLYFGALIVPGLLSLLPGRLMSQILYGAS